jgi:osmotically-inducible protein OsmY
MMTDAEIKEAVLRELAWDTRVESTEVGVEVEDGIVTLTGSVSSYGKKLAAQNAAHQVFGVHDVVNAIEVNVQGSHVRADTALAHMVRQSLEWDVMVPDSRITSTIQHGWITLEGTVDTWAQREEAERVVRHLSGVRGVTNLITASTPAILPEKVHETIQAALARRALRENRHIDVQVTGGKVTLTGTVQSWQERRAILGAVSHAPGVDIVEDHLRVNPSK